MCLLMSSAYRHIKTCFVSEKLIIICTLLTKKRRFYEIFKPDFEKSLTFFSVVISCGGIHQLILVIGVNSKSGSIYLVLLPVEMYR